jgi:hypothetical protein
LMFVVNPGFAFPESNVSSTISPISRCRVQIQVFGTMNQDLDLAT